MNKKVIIIISAVLAALLVFGSVFAIVLGVRNKNAVVSCENITMDEGVTAFFLSYYKSQFLSSLRRGGVDAYDTDSFWEREFYSGKTYGEYYLESAEKYLREISSAAYLFDEVTSLTGEDKRKIENTLYEVLDYKADGSRAKFDEQTAEFGFDYSDFEKAAKILYKAQSLRTVLFGAEGEKLEANYTAYSSYIEEYYALYSHVKLLFIRTEDRFLLDADGNRVPDASGNDTLVELSETQKAERQNTIATVRAAISAAASGADGAMTPTMFDNLLSLHGEGDADMNASGYYFFEVAEYTESFAEAFPDIVARSYSMPVGSYAEGAVDFGVCFIYKCENTSMAYTDTAVDGCFSDFFSDAADYIFARSIEEAKTKCEIKSDRFAELSPLTIPANSSLVPKF